MFAPFASSSRSSRHLEVMCPGVDARGEEADRLQVPRVRRVENCHAIAEHVADIDMAAVDHDLNAVGATALIAVGQMPDAAPNALRRNRRFRSGTGS